MKKFKFLLLLLMFVCCFACLFGCSNANERFSVTYLIDEEQISITEFKKNSPITSPALDEKDGFTFKGWYLDSELTRKWNFDTDKLHSNTILYGTWLKNYSITFIADGKTVGTEIYNTDTEVIKEPKVPDKQYYSGVWEQYQLSEKNIEVNAIYTPITYTALFKADEQIVKQFEYTVEDKIVIPEIPEKEGYTAEWSGLPLSGGNITVNARYTPIIYTVTFKDDNKTIGTREYTVENKEITPPEVPIRKGYSGEWEAFELTICNITVNAVYTLITYKATFANGYNIISVQEFDAENMLLYEPKVPLEEKAGYTTRWEEYTLSYEDIVIQAIYVPIKYTAKFVVADAIISTVEFTVESKELEVPKIPEKRGYTAVWENFVIKAENLIIKPIYTPITYYVTFMCEDTVITKVPFTVENREITEPAPLLKNGYIAKWTEYVLGFEDITVTAIYTQIVKDEFTYEQSSDGTLKITGYTGTDINITIPSEHDGKLIKSIGSLAFNGSNITGLTIGYGIEAIEKEAFSNCLNLINIELPNSLKTIGESAFDHCGFEQLTVPDSVITIEKRAFAHSKLKKVKLSNSLETLNDIFYTCEELETVNLGSSLKTICTEAFYLCTALKQLTIPASVIEIQPDSFKDCDNLAQVHFENSDNWYYYKDGDYLSEIGSESLESPATAAAICKQTKNYLKKNQASA